MQRVASSVTWCSMPSSPRPAPRPSTESSRHWRTTDSAPSCVEAGFEYREMLDRLRADDLPRFESRFKELLNENTIREVANFQSQLARERKTIKDRIARINASLGQIDYNPGRYIRLEALPAPDADVRDFQAELRACTEGALTGSGDAQYSEAKFLQVKPLLPRSRGRGSKCLRKLTPLDRRSGRDRGGRGSLQATNPLVPPDSGPRSAEYRRLHS